MTRFSAYLVIVLTALAFAIPAGAQTNAHYARVLGERAQAGAALSQQVERARARGEMESALTKRGEALNAMAASRAAGMSGGGVDWRVAAGGAAGAAALLLAGLGVAFLVRRSRHAVPAR